VPNLHKEHSRNTSLNSIHNRDKRIQPHTQWRNEGNRRPGQETISAPGFKTKPYLIFCPLCNAHRLVVNCDLVDEYSLRIDIQNLFCSDRWREMTATLSWRCNRQSAWGSLSRFSFSMIKRVVDSASFECTSVKPENANLIVALSVLKPMSTYLTT